MSGGRYISGLLLRALRRFKECQEAGIYQVGIYQAGIYQAGIYQAGIYQAGIYQAGIYQAGIYQASFLGRSVGLKNVRRPVYIRPPS